MQKDLEFNYKLTFKIKGKCIPGRVIGHTGDTRGLFLNWMELKHIARRNIFAV